jgi:hypothetical protein
MDTGSTKVTEIQTKFNVKVNEKGGFFDSIKFVPTFPFVTRRKSSDPGGWTLDDLKTLHDSLSVMFDRLANVPNGKAFFQENIGGITVKKDSALNGKGHPGETLRPHMAFWTKSELSSWTVYHEFGHAWDQARGGALSDGLEAFTGGHTDKGKAWEGCTEGDTWSPGCNDAGYFYGDIPPKGSAKSFNKIEDWAETVATFIYPAGAQSIVSSFSGPKEKLKYSDYTKLKRYQYVLLVIAGKQP